MNPTESSIYDGYTPFKAERGIASCTKSLTNGLLNDPRYVNTGINTNLNNLHEDNMINNVMMTSFGNYYDWRTEAQRKSAQTLGLWTRQTLSWKLSSDADSATSRYALIDAVKEPFEFPDRIFVAAVFA